MASLTEEQVELIRRRLLREGIDSEELGNDILDHLCTSIENEMDRTPGFDRALEKALDEFLPSGGFRRIQFEVNMLNIKTILMKKTILISALIASLVFFISILLLSFRAISEENGVFVAFFNQFALCFFILPLYWIHQYQSAKGELQDGFALRTKAFMFLIGFLCSEALVNAVFLNIMHMPGGNLLFIIGAALGVIYAPLYCLRKYRMYFTLVK